MSDLDEIKEKEAQAEELMENLRKLTPEQIRAFRNMIIGVATMNDIMAMDANFDDFCRKHSDQVYRGLSLSRVQYHLLNAIH